MSSGAAYVPGPTSAATPAAMPSSARNVRWPRRKGLPLASSKGIVGIIMQRVNGLPHITAICGPAQETLDFYAGVLGMRLVKRSVIQDDPGTYHLFYADATGSPGSDLT